MAHQASAARLLTIQQKTRRKALSIFTAHLPIQPSLKKPPVAVLLTEHALIILPSWPRIRSG